MMTIRAASAHRRGRDYRGILFILPAPCPGAIMPFPILVGICLTHFTVAPTGAPIAIILLAIHGWVVYDNREKVPADDPVGVSRRDRKGDAEQRGGYLCLLRFPAFLAHSAETSAFVSLFMCYHKQDKPSRLNSVRYKTVMRPEIGFTNRVSMKMGLTSNRDRSSPPTARRSLQAFKWGSILDEVRPTLCRSVSRR